MPAFIETFESLDEWTIDPDTSQTKAIISRVHAVDGDTSARVDYATRYNVSGDDEFAMHRLDLVDGGNPATTYWLSYAFLVEDWADVWFSGVANSFWMLGMTDAVDDTTIDTFFANTLLDATSQTTGILFSSSYPLGVGSVAITAGVWHTVRMSLISDGVNVQGSIWVDGVFLASNTTAFATNAPTGVWLGNDLTNVGGTVWYDDVRWSPGVNPGDPSTVETAPGTSDSQWVKIVETAGGVNNAWVYLEADPTGAGDPVSEMYAYVEVYIPGTFLTSALGNNESLNTFMWFDNALLTIKRIGVTSNFIWVNGSLEIEHPLVANVWHRIEYHAVEGESTVEVRIDGTLYSDLTPDFGPLVDPQTAFQLMRPNQSTTEGIWIGYDNMMISTEGWVANHAEVVTSWDFEGVDPLGDAVPPRYVADGPNDWEVRIQEAGMPGAGPGLPTAFPPPGGGGGGGGEEGEGGGGFGGVGFGGFSGRRFFKSFPWRCIVVDGNVDDDGNDVGEGATITMLDRLGSDREMVVKIGEARTWRTVVPSYEPQVNIGHDDEWEEAFVAEGNRLLYVFRRENGDPLWICRGAFLLQKLSDTAETEDSRSTIYGYDPRQLLYSRKAMNPETGRNIGKTGYTYVGDDAGQIAHDVLTTMEFGAGAEDGQGFTRIDSNDLNILTDPGESTIDSFHITQGMSVGEVWDELEATGKLEIYLDPLYDPIGFPGYLARAYYYTQMGEDNPTAVFAWDKPARSLVGVDHEKDGTQRANIIRFGRGQGGKVVDEEEDLTSIDKYGKYYKQQWFPVQKKAAAVTALARGELEKSTDGRHTVQIQPAPERSPVALRDYQLGDTVGVYWSRNMRQAIYVPSRVVEIPIRITDDGLEELQRAVVEPQDWVIGT